MEKTSLINFLNQHYQMGCDMIDEMDNNISLHDALKLLNYLMNEILAVSEQIKTQYLKHCTHEDSEFNSQNRPVAKEEDDDLMVVQSQGDNSVTAGVVPTGDSVDNISTNSMIAYSPTPAETESVESRYRKCKALVKCIDVNDTRTKRCSVALKRLCMSNILKTHKLELIRVNWPSRKQEAKENRNSSMKLKRQKNIKTVKVDRKPERKCISRDDENLSDGCCIQ